VYSKHSKGYRIHALGICLAEVGSGCCMADLSQRMPRAGVDYPKTFGQFQDWFSTEEGCFEYLRDCAGARLRSAIAVWENESLACVSGHPLDLGPICLGDFRRERDQVVGPGLGNPTGAGLGPAIETEERIRPVAE